MSGHFNYIELEKKYLKLLDENAVMERDIRKLQEEKHDLKEKLQVMMLEND